jgi:hypothetical protein
MIAVDADRAAGVFSPVSHVTTLPAERFGKPLLAHRPF